MNKSVRGLIAVAVFGGVGYLIYRWVKKGGLNKLLNVGTSDTAVQKAVVQIENTPIYSYDKTSNKWQPTPLTFLQKGDVVGNYYGRNFIAKFNNGQTFNALVVYRPDESGVIIEKERVKLK